MLLNIIHYTKGFWLCEKTLVTTTRLSVQLNYDRLFAFNHFREIGCGFM